MITQQIANVDTLRIAGKTVEDACNEVGISQGLYYRFKREQKEIEQRNTNRGLTLEEKKQKVDLVNQEVDKGHKLEIACKTIGISTSSYYNWNKSITFNKIQENAYQPETKDDEIKRLKQTIEHQEERLESYMEEHKNLCLDYEKLRQENVILKKHIADQAIKAILENNKCYNAPNQK